MNVFLDGFFLLRSPLSHIGESISTTSYLAQEPILQPDGCVEEVFCYSGNAWRGQLRDLAAMYFCEKLGLKLKLDSFHMLFSGGKIGGDQKIDVEHAKKIRKLVPIFSLFGGGMGNQILPGKLKVSNNYPVCREAIITLPDWLQAEAMKKTHKSMTFEKSFSRKDDSKNPMVTTRFLSEKKAIGTDIETDGDGAKSKKVVPEQMRMTSELVAAGVQLYTEIIAIDVNDIELGALVSALNKFSQVPFIGGQGNKGHGKVDLAYSITDMDTGVKKNFINIKNTQALLTPHAASAKDSYDRYLKEIYDSYLIDKQTELHLLLA